MPTRGHLRGIGRGQTHKARIIRLWLGGATFDQIAYQSRHSLTAIQRYIQTFVRLVELHQQHLAKGHIALLLAMGVPLVREYLTVYQQSMTPEVQERLVDQLAQLGQASSTPRGGL